LRISRTQRRQTTIEGYIDGSLAGQPTAPLVAVSNVGRAADFASVVKGAIAIVRAVRSVFGKAQNAAAVLESVNTESGNLPAARLEVRRSAGSLQVSGGPCSNGRG